MQHHRTGFINATALGEWQQGGCSEFFFFSLWDSGGKSMGEDDQKDQEGLTVYRESGKNVVKGVSQDAKSN